MKALIVLAAVAAVASVATPATAVKCVTPIAHRGVHNATVDEDTLDAIRGAATLGPAEIDVHVTADDRLVVIHDSKLDRTTTGTGLIHDLTLAQIHKARTDHGSLVPTLAQAARVADRWHVTLLVELKQYPQWTPALFEQASTDAAGGRVYLGGHGSGFARDIPLYTHRLVYAFTQDPTVDLVMDRLANWTPAKVAALGDLGVRTSARLTHDTAGADVLGLDYLLTNTPHRAAAYCERAA